MNNRLLKKINIDYILKNYFYLIVLLLIPLILVSGFLYLIVPNYESMRIELGTAIDLENKYSELKINHIKKLKDYKSDVSLIDSSRLEKIKKILPYNNDTAVIINEISQISKKANISIEKITFSEEKDSNIVDANETDTKGIKKINFSVDVKNGNDYKTFKKFLSEIESNIRLFDVKSFYVTNDFERYSFDIVCYYKEI